MAEKLLFWSFSSIKFGLNRKYLPSIWLLFHYASIKWPWSSIVMPKPSSNDFDLLAVSSISLKCLEREDWPKSDIWDRASTYFLSPLCGENSSKRLSGDYAELFEAWMAFLNSWKLAFAVLDIIVRLILLLIKLSSLRNKSWNPKRNRLISLASKKVSTLNNNYNPNDNKWINNAQCSWKVWASEVFLQKRGRQS